MNENGQKATSGLDHAIDLVAREMTNLDAPAGTRVAVLARIENAPARTGSTLLPRWAWAPGVAVVVLAVSAAVWFARPAVRPESVTVRHDASSTPAAGTTQPQPRPSETLASAGAAASLLPGLTVEPRAAAVQPEEIATAAPEMGPAALPQPEPIVLAALGPDALQIPDISIAPFGDFKPITIQDIPVGSTEIQRRQNR
jgi:hypothetical protein